MDLPVRAGGCAFFICNKRPAFTDLWGKTALHGHGGVKVLPRLDLSACLPDPTRHSACWTVLISGANNTNDLALLDSAFKQQRLTHRGAVRLDFIHPTRATKGLAPWTVTSMKTTFPALSKQTARISGIT
ncbi:hypothetical protein [Sulfitobacter sp. M368]|uniref:hypothetical protein n=1 Tax=Sulfitobacter sp. M368 TaxID=2867021 RepID=UPI0021A93C60|nr:hypothetical protein [Sulfitobacter sp. M368]UWR15726.1 hypothetical protein K3754_02130 [Sulfitobacter sp. M368]